MHASVVEWSITTDCKSVGLRPTKVRILPDAPEQNLILHKILTRIFFNMSI